MRASGRGATSIHEGARSVTRQGIQAAHNGPLFSNVMHERVNASTLILVPYEERHDSMNIMIVIISIIAVICRMSKMMPCRRDHKWSVSVEGFPVSRGFKEFLRWRIQALPVQSLVQVQEVVEVRSPYVPYMIAELWVSGILGTMWAVTKHGCTSQNADGS